MPAPSSTPTDAPADAPADAAIRVEGLTKTFGRVRALDGVDFSIPAGALVGLVGTNGSGKSTLLKVLGGLVGADGGTAEVLGLHAFRDRRRLRAHVGYAGQDAALDPEMTGRETLHLFDALYGLPRPGRAVRPEEHVAAYGLEGCADRPVATYSGGQRQRLHLALAVLHAPRLLLLDEPTTSLDPEGRRDLWQRLAAWSQAGRTILVATHDLADVAAACSRVLLLRAGRLLAADHPAALVAAHGRACTVVTLAAPPADAGALRRALAGLPGAPDVALDDWTLTLWRDRPLDGAEPALDVLAAHGVACRTFERRDPDLAGAYFRLTGSPLAPSPEVTGDDRPQRRGERHHPRRA